MDLPLLSQTTFSKMGYSKRNILALAVAAVIVILVVVVMVLAILLARKEEDKVERKEEQVQPNGISKSYQM